MMAGRCEMQIMGLVDAGWGIDGKWRIGSRRWLVQSVRRWAIGRGGLIYIK